MHTSRSPLSSACRAATFVFAFAGAGSLLQAQQVRSVQPVFSAPLATYATASAKDYFSSSSSSSSSSSADSADAADAVDRLAFDASALNTLQPPPRRRYGRPRYSDSHTNPDGSNKFAFMAGGGVSLPIGNTHKYETPSWGFQAGAGRNFSQSVGVMLQFDYDHFGLQGSTITNQQNLYNYGVPAGNQLSGLDGNNHVWSFTLDPTFSLVGQGSVGAYAVVGAGFYHKVTNFTVPTVGTYCDFYYGCYQYQANQVIDHYTSNAPGVNGGLGLTYKFSKFSSQRFYIEARYVVIFNKHYAGLTAFNVGTPFGASYTGYNFYPANSNRTTYIPIKVGIRF
jgi:hypothetical protein